MLRFILWITAAPISQAAATITRSVLFVIAVLSGVDLLLGMPGSVALTHALRAGVSSWLVCIALMALLYGIGNAVRSGEL